MFSVVHFSLSCLGVCVAHSDPVVQILLLLKYPFAVIQPPGNLVSLSLSARLAHEPPDNGLPRSARGWRPLFPYRDALLRRLSASRRDVKRWFGLVIEQLAVGANDGLFTLWLDGLQIATFTSFEQASVIDHIHLGAASGIDVNTRVRCTLMISSRDASTLLARE